MEDLGGVHPYPSDANFILFRTGKDSAKVFQELKAEGVLVRDLGRPGPLENCLRVTVGTAEENTAFITALRKILP
jgi:histidinol-phosphate aminotransferase